MKHKTISLKWKMFSILASLIIIMLSIFWVFQIFFVKDIYRVIKGSELKKRGEVIAKNIDHDNLSVLLTRISNLEETTIMILTKDGDILEQVDSKFGTINHLTVQTLLEKMEKSKNSNNSYFEIVPYENIIDDGYAEYSFEGNIDSKNRDSAESMIYVKIAKNQKGEDIGIILDTKLAPVYLASKTTMIMLTVVSVGVLLVALGITFILSKSVVDPIVSITKSAGELAKGKTSVRFDGGGYKEIEELKEALNYAAKEIAKVEDLRRELIANVSHDLRTPLTLIKGYSEMIRDIPAEASPENLQVIIDETERLSGLVNDMLDLSRLQEGEEYLSLTHFDVVKTIKTIKENHARLLKTQGYTLEFYHEERAIVVGDQPKITQVIYNLISNAVNYSGEDKLVVIKQYSKNGNARIEVIDNGEGIDVDSLPHIWDRYYKSEKSHKRGTVGVGLGLSIVKNIMGSHPGGKYGVESSVGNGSKFYIELPLAPNEKKSRKSKVE